MEPYTGPNPREYEFDTRTASHTIAITIKLAEVLECRGADIDGLIAIVEQDIRERLAGYRDIEIDAELE